MWFRHRCAHTGFFFYVLHLFHLKSPQGDPAYVYPHLNIQVVCDPISLNYMKSGVTAQEGEDGEIFLVFKAAKFSDFLSAVLPLRNNKTTTEGNIKHGRHLEKPQYSPSILVSQASTSLRLRSSSPLSTHKSSSWLFRVRTCQSSSNYH